MFFESFPHDSEYVIYMGEPQGGFMIGRTVEQKELLRALESVQSEFVALYGRRRVGKTYLVNEFFNGKPNTSREELIERLESIREGR